VTQRQPDRSPPHEATGARPADRLAKILKWVTAGTAVLTLIFGIRTLTNIITQRGAREKQIGELLGTAQLQRDGRDYPSAWASLVRAAELDGDDDACDSSGGRAMNRLRISVATPVPLRSRASLIRSHRS
jgi:hypothetical protein